MELLKKIIREQGQVVGNDIIKVDSFLNHQMDVKLFNEMGKEFKERFKNEKIDKILTIEASGIGIATIISQYFDYIPVVFAKKSAGSNLDSELYHANVHSFTKSKDYDAVVNKRFINKGERILIIDDFLANGCAACGLIDIARQGGAEVAAVGIIIEKGFQPGRKVIESLDVKVESLVIISNIENGHVVFK